jgi:site-specific DNA-methyltransferase (cytosine-N4-specific)
MDWEQLESDTRYATHGIHRYSGKFIPQIAGQVIELVSAPGELVVDPYVGSGTTLLESALRGRKSIGIDINPLACLISRVKTTPIDSDNLDGLTLALASRVDLHEVGVGTSLRLFNDEEAIDVRSDARWVDEWFIKWFPDERRHELIILDHIISALPDESFRLVARVAFSDVIRQASLANNSFPNVMFDKKKTLTRSAVNAFLRKLSEVSNSVSMLDGKIADEMVPEVVLASACNIPLANESADAVITHPPYIGSIPYAEYGSLSLKWLGENPKDLDAKLTGGKRQSRDVIERFRVDFDASIHECFRILKPGKRMVMLLGSPTVRGDKIDLPEMAKVMSKESGFQLEAATSRRGGNRRANLMAEESLLFFNKG